MRDIGKLEEIARQVRIDVVTMLNAAGSGHTGGSLSATDLLVALFFGKINLDPFNPKWVRRDRFVLSKGHAAPAYYAVLSRLGFFDREELLTLRKFGSCLQGHPDCSATPGVEVCSGSLGQGLSVANGMALAARLDGLPIRVYVLLGDGEVQEGQIWEAAMSAAHFKLHNVTALLDNNKLQIDGKVEDIMNIEPLTQKWQAFGWQTIEIDGHNLAQILEALDAAEEVKDRPSIIIASTIKGKGVSIFENKVEYHGVAPTDEELAIALKELGAY
ncbi:MAG: transketolase [Deltaproteobacteria bacterium]|nr:transketolase [Deltaproteobacteria bacterium]MBW1953001.1 transketolase [Deltaproteobacteria bacterium]MBW1985940.1 transketolase [Deltaproteobacteria bacterium]MBW2133700.1 transketolase [Deltaproteobacteria bacterium]